MPNKLPFDVKDTELIAKLNKGKRINYNTDKGSHTLALIEKNGQEQLYYGLTRNVPKHIKSQKDFVTVDTMADLAADFYVTKIFTDSNQKSLEELRNGGNIAISFEGKMHNVFVGKNAKLNMQPVGGKKVEGHKNNLTDEQIQEAFKKIVKTNLTQSEDQGKSQEIRTEKQEGKKLSVFAQAREAVAIVAQALGQAIGSSRKQPDEKVVEPTKVGQSKIVSDSQTQGPEVKAEEVGRVPIKLKKPIVIGGHRAKVVISDELIKKAQSLTPQDTQTNSAEKNRNKGKLNSQGKGSKKVEFS